MGAKVPGDSCPLLVQFSFTFAMWVLKTLDYGLNWSSCHVQQEESGSLGLAGWLASPSALDCS